MHKYISIYACKKSTAFASQIFTKLMCRSLILDFIQIRNIMWKVNTTSRMPQSEVRQRHQFSCGYLLYCISPSPVRKYESFTQNIIYSFPTVKADFHKSHTRSTTFGKDLVPWFLLCFDKQCLVTDIKSQMDVIMLDILFLIRRECLQNSTSCLA